MDYIDFCYEIAPSVLTLEEKCTTIPYTDFIQLRENSIREASLRGEFVAIIVGIIFDTIAKRVFGNLQESCC